MSLILQPLILTGPFIFSKRQPLYVINHRIIPFLVPSRAQSTLRRNEKTKRNNDETEWRGDITKRRNETSKRRNGVLRWHNGTPGDETMSQTTKRSNTVPQRDDDTTKRHHGTDESNILSLISLHTTKSLLRRCWAQLCFPERPAHRRWKKPVRGHWIQVAVTLG